MNTHPLFEPGQVIRVRFRKFDGTPHWEHDGIYLGADKHGLWLSEPAGTVLRRPGREVIESTDVVVLIPHSGQWIARVYGPGDPELNLVYIDISSDVRVHESGWVSAIDMDLDVRRRTDQSLYIDDEDEFELHAARYGYPDELIAEVERTARELLDDVRAHAPRFHSKAASWLRRSAVS